MEKFYTVKKQDSAQYVIEKSRFIGYAKRVTTVEEAKRFIGEIKKKHADAKHNCYAYSINDNGVFNKFSDDGEPQGTAGLPIMEVIKNKNLTNVVIVVTRYFGGILLGAGGLVRAYTEASVRAVNKAGVSEFIYSSVYALKVDFNLGAKVIKLVDEAGKKQAVNYTANGVEITLAVPLDNAKNFLNKFTDITLGKGKFIFINNEFIEY